MYQREERDIISEARNEEHIIDQWITLRNRVPYLHERTQKLSFRLIMRTAAVPNAQTECERANPDYNITKTKLSSSMKIPFIKVCLRTKLNGPPLSLFNPMQVRKRWLENGHQYAAIVTEQKLVIQRIRVSDKKKYTNKIFE